jgi:hypothetical protein
MAWPTPQDYQEAIQNPQVNLGDAELRAGRVALDALGLPRPISGNFASVYRVACGPDTWAVRCFLHPVTDQQQRYAEISRQLQASRLPYTVGFAYLQNGVRVRGQWYPVLKMEWVQGIPLHEYVRQHLTHPAALLDLAARWLEMVQTLQRAGIAHGDLQHGNVIVVGDRPKLIDYDGMYVPALAGRKSPELGHRHYQHPLRTEADFGPATDRFSAWVIYAALVALAADASLWSSAGAGEEYLLLRDGDFRDPDASGTLAALAGHGDPRLRALADLVRTMVRLPVSAVPSLDGSVSLGGQPVLPGPDGVVTRTLPPGTDWLSDHLRPASRPGAPGAGPDGPAEGPAGDRRDGDGDSRPAPHDPGGPERAGRGQDWWVLDHVLWGAGQQGPRVARLAPPGEAPRGVALACAGLAVVCLISPLLGATLPLGTLATLAGAVLVAGVAILYHLYGRDPAVQAVRAGRRDVRRLAGRAQGLESASTALAATHRRTEARLDRRDRRDGAALQDLARREGVARQAAQERANRPVQEIQDRIAQIGRSEGDELQRARTKSQVVVAQINSALSALNAREQQELSVAASTARRRWVEGVLRTKLVAWAAVPGIGFGLRAALATFGITTAADVTYYRVRSVPGIGDARAAALAKWRRDHEAKAMASFPPAMITAVVAQVEARYRPQREALERDRAARANDLAALEDEIRARHDRQRQAFAPSLRRAMEEARQQAQREGQAITQRYDRRRVPLLQRATRSQAERQARVKAHGARSADVAQELWRVNWELAGKRRSLEPYRDVTFRRYLGWALLGRPA